MPLAKIDRIVSFSSEDNVHVANNILGNNASLKWKCKNPGEKNATIVLQLEKACLITGIDIGNEHSAYIEVLVSRSGAEEDYKVLLVMSSFMTPLESRQSSNINKVRMFSGDDLSKPECEQKWDRIKILCTQPFNRHVQYGLSFIKIHTLPDRYSDGGNVKLGKFTLKSETPVDEINTGFLFTKKKEHKDEPLTGAAAIRAANSSPSIKPKITHNLHKLNFKTSTQVDTSPKPRNRAELLYNADDEKPHKKIDEIMEKKRAEDEAKQKEKDDERSKNKTPAKTPKAVKKETKTDTNLLQTPSGESSQKRKLSENNNFNSKKPKKVNLKPFNKLMEDVVFVISGFVNPDRSTLRDKFLEMGAKYKPDWNNSCTHLLCAFANTPKFNQVKGKGKIITRKWVEDCYSQRKRLPWRRYALDNNDKNKNESEDEICELVEDNPLNNAKELNSTISSDEDTRLDYSDTEDLVEKFMTKNVEPRETSIYLVDTDEEDMDKTQESCGIFKNKTFFINHCFSNIEESQIRQYIMLCGGLLLDDPLDDIDYFITDEQNAENLKEINSKPTCIHSRWIHQCYNNQKLLLCDNYIL